MERGKYIMFEGGEGCGKDFQAKFTGDYLNQKGYNVLITREPGGTPEAEQIRNVLLNKNNKLDSMTELFLYEASRRELSQKVILPSINEGKIVISSRGFPSTHAYQGFGGGLKLESIEKLNAMAIEGVIPDIIFLLDIDPYTGLKKEVNPDRFAAKGIEYHQRVREGYLNFLEKYKDVTVIIPYQEGKPDAMQGQIRKHLSERLNL